ncbi:hypothetical protein D3C81_1493120 [compost metagenome]
MRRRRGDVLPGGVALALWPHRHGDEDGGPGREELPHRAGEAGRARPGELPRNRQRRGPCLRRASGLPHRPLPGQGDGAEPDRPAVRQHHLRALVEQSDGRSRPDHGRRDGGGRRPLALLRRIRRSAGHAAEPYAAAAVPGGHGAAQRPGPGLGAQREGQGAAVLAPHHPGRSRARHRARPVCGGDQRGQTGPEL